MQRRFLRHSELRKTIDGGSMSDNMQVGKIGWIDMTVDDADGVQDFYMNGVSRQTEAVSVGDYFCIIRDPSGATAALYQP
jgi:predicted enzyme related to lactoylglutathione lyase